MKKLEKIFAGGSFIIGLSLVGFGLYRDNNISNNHKNYIKNTLIKTVGLSFLSAGYGILQRKMVEKEYRKYFDGQKKKDIYLK